MRKSFERRVNPYEAGPSLAHVPSRYIDRAKLAGRLLRCLSAGLDGFFELVLVFVLVSPESMADRDAPFDWMRVVPYLAIFVMEIAFNTTPAKLLLGLSVVYQEPGVFARLKRTVPKYFCAFIPFLPVLFTRDRQGIHDRFARAYVLKKDVRLRALRATAGLLAGIYLIATFGMGPLFDLLVDRRVDWERVNQSPTAWEAPAASDEPRLSIWNDGLRYELAPRVAGLGLEETYYSHPYRRRLGPDRPRGVVLSSHQRLDHPVNLCQDYPLFSWFLPCRESPILIQDAFFEVTATERFYLSPLTMVGLNAAIIAKNIALSGEPDFFFFRRIAREDLTIVWVGTRDRNVKDDGTETIVDRDTLYIASEDDFTVGEFVWAAVPRDEQLIRDFIATLRFEAASEGAAEAELSEARRTRSKTAYFNALRLGTDKLVAAEALYEIFRRGGSTFERDRFASWIRSHVQETGDLRFLTLLEKTESWRIERDE